MRPGGFSGSGISWAEAADGIPMCMLDTPADRCKIVAASDAQFPRPARQVATVRRTIPVTLWSHCCWTIVTVGAANYHSCLLFEQKRAGPYSISRTCDIPFIAWSPPIAEHLAPLPRACLISPEDWI